MQPSSEVIPASPPDLVAWLREQIDEDERVAQAAMALPGRDRYYFPDGPVDGKYWEWRSRPDDGQWGAVGRSVEGVGIEIYDEGGHDEHQAVHIARHDPARALREVEAKRLIVADIEEATCTSGATWLLADRILRCLALPYADRPGYREEWRP